MNTMNPKAISDHSCRFSSWVILALSKEGGVGVMLGVVYQSHKASLSWRLPLNRNFSMLDEAGSIEKGL